MISPAETGEGTVACRNGFARLFLLLLTEFAAEDHRVRCCSSPVAAFQQPFLLVAPHRQRSPSLVFLSGTSLHKYTACVCARAQHYVKIYLVLKLTKISMPPEVRFLLHPSSRTPLARMLTCHAVCDAAALHGFNAMLLHPWAQPLSDVFPPSPDSCESMTIKSSISKSSQST